MDFFLSGGRGAAAVPSATTEQTQQLEVELLVPNPNQPRGEMAVQTLDELAASIRESGLLQPILARRVGDRYEIVAGERRWRAAQLAGLAKVPVLIRSITDEESAVFALVENLQREDLNAIEKARAFQQLQSRFQSKTEDVARRVGLDRSTVANFLRLLDLPAEVQAHVSRGTLSMGHARSLLGVADAEGRIRLADEAVRRGMSVRQLEEMVRDLAGTAGQGPESPTKAKARPRNREAWLHEIEETLVEALGTPVRVHYGRKRSQIIIECAGRDEFERIYSRLKES